VASAAARYGRRSPSWRGLQRVELVLHLAGREAASSNRFTLLGWAWPVLRQLAQLGVLVLVFSKFLRIGIENYPVFVFCGLIVWNWFSAALPIASYSILSSRHLVLQPGFPSATIPAVSVTVPLIDMVLALPAFLVVLALDDQLRWGAVALLGVLAIELVLLCGLAWIVAAIGVYLRDVPNVVTILLTFLFYMTPIFYDREIVPPELHWVLDINPVAVLIEATRAATLDLPAPSLPHLLAVAAVAAATSVVGFLLFRRLEPGFPDEL
jgi:lipopolysaccharide transport system permease protein